MTGVWRIWCVALWLSWACLLFGGFLLGPADASGSQRIPTWARMLSSFVLVVAGWSWYLLPAESPAKRISLFIAVGMTLGFIGDLFLADLVRSLPSVQGGMAAFGLGHVAYIAGMIYFGNQSGRPGPRRIAVSLWILIGLVGWFFIAFLSSEPAPLRWAALLYTLLLAATAGYATALALESWIMIPVGLGLVLFFASDMILAGQLFRRFDFPLINSVVWLTYGPAQMLIVYGGNMAARFLSRPIQKPSHPSPINVEAMFTADSSLEW
jgi:uncharacterized membrane protein YhhN